MPTDHAAPREGQSAPVAWRFRDKEWAPWNFCRDEDAAKGAGWRYVEPLYATGALAPATSVEAMATLDEMAGRLRSAVMGCDGFELTDYEAREVLAQSVTGLPPGPERDAALASILARLGRPAQTASSRHATPSYTGNASNHGGGLGDKAMTLAEAACARLVRRIVQAVDKHAVDTASDDHRWSDETEIHFYDAAGDFPVVATLGEFRAALAGQPAGDGWSFDMDAAPRDGTILILHARVEGATACGIVIGWWHSGNAECPRAGWIASSFVGQGIRYLVPEAWRPRPPFPAPPAQRPVQGGDRHGE